MSEPELEPESLPRGVLEAIPGLVCVVDGAGRLVWWNDRLRTRTGHCDTELAGMDVLELLEPPNHGDGRAAFERLEADGPAVFDVVGRDGERSPCEFDASTLDLGGPTAVVCVGREAAGQRDRTEFEVVDGIGEVFYGVIQTALEAPTRGEIETALCERLVASGLYRSAWIGRNDSEGPVEPSESTGPVEAFFEAVAGLEEDDGWTCPATTAVERAEVVVRRIEKGAVPEPIAAVAAEHGITHLAAVPVFRRDRVTGVLSVSAARPDAFDERERVAFRRLGAVVGLALAAVHNERLLLSDTATELTFRITGSYAFLASVSSFAEGACRHLWSTPVESGACRHYLSASGVDPETVLAVADETPRILEIEHVGEDDDRHVFSVVTSDSLVLWLLDAGASPVSVVARDGETTVVAELPGEADARPIVEGIEERYGGELVSKRGLDRPVRTADEFEEVVGGRLTDRQLTALRHAFFGGYFSWPRDATAEEVARRMDISSATLHYHIRQAQQTLVEAYLEHLDG